MMPFIAKMVDAVSPLLVAGLFAMLADMLRARWIEGEWAVDDGGKIGNRYHIRRIAFATFEMWAKADEGSGQEWMASFTVWPWFWLGRGVPVTGKHAKTCGKVPSGHPVDAFIKPVHLGLGSLVYSPMCLDGKREKQTLQRVPSP